MKRLVTCTRSALLFCCAAGLAVADTGTYEIPEYRVTLLPEKDGNTEIAYYQKWRVTGGHIPWITVGTPNANFTVLSDGSRGNIRHVKSACSRNWSGVRIDLDSDYQAGETFEVEFAIRQGDLFYADEQGYRLDFTPGWYERAKIGKLVVKLEFFTDLAEVLAGPEPQQMESRFLAWEKSNLVRGERFPISVTFPEHLFPGPIRLAQAQPARSRGGLRTNPWVIVAVTLLVPAVLLVIVLSRSARGGYGGGSIRRGGIGYRAGTCVVSCACACVACACACACAGGGAAGCDRKLKHACPLGATCQREDCPLHPAGSGYAEIERRSGSRFASPAPTHHRR
jgi:hypothetical protein